MAQHFNVLMEIYSVDKNGKNLKERWETTVETDSKVHGLCSHISEYTGIEPRDGLLMGKRVT